MHFGASAISAGSGTITNSGTIQASGGGLTVQNGVSNSGLLWANGGNLTVQGTTNGSGMVSAAVDLSREIWFDGKDRVA